MENSVFNDNGNENILKYSLDIYNPRLLITGVAPGEAPISPYESETFCVCQSQYNCWLLTDAGGFYKCCCNLPKLIKKYINISMDIENKGSHATNSTYLHNTEITSSDIQQEAYKKAQRCNAKHPDGKCASLTDMLHVMLRYPEVYTDLRFLYAQFH